MAESAPTFGPPLHGPYDTLAQALLEDIANGGNQEIRVNVSGNDVRTGVETVFYNRPTVALSPYIGKRSLRDHVIAFTEMVGAEPDESELRIAEIDLITIMLIKKICQNRAFNVSNRIKKIVEAQGVTA